MAKATTNDLKRSKGKKKAREPFVPQPATPAVHTWEKDDEELDLEARLFGGSKAKSNGRNVGDIEVDHTLAGVDDEDLFTIDAPVHIDDEGDDSDDSSISAPSLTFDDKDDSNDEASDEEAVEYANRDGDEDEDGGEGENQPEVEIGPNVEDEPISRKRKKGEQNGEKEKKKALWVDEADEGLEVDMEGDKRMRKLVRGEEGGERAMGRELEKKLRAQFELLHPRPEWVQTRQKTTTPSLSTLLQSNKSFISTSHPSTSRAPLPANHLELSRLRNANAQNPTTGKKDAKGAGKGVVGVEWHPSERVGVVAVLGGDRRVRMFNIDGDTNPTLLTLHLPALPLLKATYHPSGSTLLLTGPRPYYYTYDLSTSRILRSPRNLFGSQPSPSSPNTLDRHAFSPDGTLLAVAGRRGVVSVMNWSGMGVGGVVAELKSGRGGGVEGLLWGEGGRDLSVLGGREGMEVERWDLGERRIVGKWKDERAFGGRMLRGSGDGKYTAVGSTTGIVNLYTSDLLCQKGGEFTTLTPEPMKSLEHLTTPISTMSFHPSSQLLCTASSEKKDMLRMYHLPSGTAYSNWPTQHTPLGRVNCVSFSSGGQYLTVGNHKGQVLLYNVKHFSDPVGSSKRR